MSTILENELRLRQPIHPLFAAFNKFPYFSLHIQLFYLTFFERKQNQTVNISISHPN